MKSTNTTFRRRLYFRIGFAVLVFLLLFLYRIISDRTDISSGKPTGPVLTNLSPKNMPLSQGTQFSEQTLETLNPTGQVAPQLLGKVTFLDGSSTLKLTENDVAIGMAEIFQDVLDNSEPPLTIFIIYGETDISISLQNGGWDVWENASEEFVNDQISEKIQKVKETYRDEFEVRGYRVIECYSQVKYCIVLESTKP